MKAQITFNWIAKWATYSPNHIAIVDVDNSREYSYSELNQIVQNYTMKLNQLGIKKGDRIALLSQNRVEYVFLFFASQQIGSIIVPINFRLKQPEVEHVIKDCNPDLWVYSESYDTYVQESSYSKKALSFNELKSWNSLESSEEWLGLIENNVQMDDVCMILYTSGTTGLPKGAMISNQMIFWNSINTGLRLDLTQKDVSFAHAPFFHTGGWNVLTTPLLHRGATLIFISKFDAAKILDLIESYKATIIWGVPTMMDFLYSDEAFKSTDLSSVRYAVVGGEPMPIPLIEKWQQKGVPIRQGYGLTEFGPNVFSLNEEDAIRKSGSIGFPNFYIDVKVVDDNGNEVKENQPGELWLHGHVITKGYWNNAEATSKSIENGWFKTGDIVKYDSEGYFYVVDRKKDMFISGGENVYPAEIEHVIRGCKGIKEVAVIGVEDEKWGEVGKAFLVVEKLDQDDAIEMVKAHCKEKLATFKIPKYFNCIKELPKSDTGKILKRKLNTYKSKG